MIGVCYACGGFGGGGTDPSSKIKSDLGKRS